MTDSLREARATLRILGDDLVPDEISRLLGARPTTSRIKGEVFRTPNGRPLTARTGSWDLRASTVHNSEDLDGQVAELLTQLTNNLDVWASLSEKFRIDLFCGWFMKTSNAGVAISPASLSALGDRRIILELDIYDGSHSVQL
jgi:hypothetical protein